MSDNIIHMKSDSRGVTQKDTKNTDLNNVLTC